MNELDFSHVRVRDSIILGDPAKAVGFVCFGGSIYLAAQKKPSPEQLGFWEGSLGITWAEHSEVYMFKDEKE